MSTSVKPKQVNPFKCSLCGASFKDAETFSIHLSNHSIEVMDEVDEPDENGSKDSQKGVARDDSETETASEVEIILNRTDDSETETASEAEMFLNNPEIQDLNPSTRESPAPWLPSGRKGLAPAPCWDRFWDSSGSDRTERLGEMPPREVLAKNIVNGLDNLSITTSKKPRI